MGPLWVPYRPSPARALSGSGRCVHSTSDLVAEFPSCTLASNADFLSADTDLPKHPAFSARGPR